MTEGSRHYEIMEPVGRGGMGTIYRARLTGEGGFSKQVALKIPSGTPTPEDLERLRDEGRVLGLLRHRAIVGVDGLVQLGESWAVVMEYVEGVDLAMVLKHSGRLPEGVALEIISEVAAALEAAQQATDTNGQPLGLQHRDIKPGNILVTLQGEVKVLDFGIARADFASRESVTADQHFGSAGYMAPERLDGIDHPSSDVYSVGVVLYELLTGSRLGKASAHEGRHIAHMTGAIAEMGPETPVQVLLSNLLDYTPDHRHDVREIQRQCVALRPAIGLHLRDWAEFEVPALLERKRADLAEDVAGSDPIESPSLNHAGSDDKWFTPPTARLRPPTTPPQPPIDPGPAQPDTDPTTKRLAFAGLGLLFFAMLVWLLLPGTVSRDAAPPQGVSTSRGEPEGAPTEPSAEPAPESQPEAPQPAEPEVPQLAVPVVPQPAAPEAPPPATPEPVPLEPLAHVPPTAPAGVPPTPTAPPESAQVNLTGDATVVTLTGPSGSYRLPSSVPAGVYTIRASFEGVDTIPVGEAIVPSEGTVRVDCSAAFIGCRMSG